MAAVLRSSPKMRTSFSRSVRVQWHSLFRSVWLGALAIYIIRLNETDSLHYYLAPSLHPLLLCCPVPLLFISAIMGWQGVFGHKHVHCDCEHPPPSGWIRTSLTYGLVCFPLLLGFLLPDLALGSAMASQKGMALSYAPPEIRRKEPLPEANAMKVQDINGLPSRMDASKASMQLPRGKCNSYRLTNTARSSPISPKSCTANRSFRSIRRFSRKRLVPSTCFNVNLQANPSR